MATDGYWLFITVVIQVSIGILAAPFFTHELPRDGGGNWPTKRNRFIALYVFAWAVFGSVLVTWAIGYGAWRYLNAWILFFRAWKRGY